MEYVIFFAGACAGGAIVWLFKPQIKVVKDKVETEVKKRK